MPKHTDWQVAGEAAAKFIQDRIDELAIAAEAILKLIPDNKPVEEMTKGELLAIDTFDSYMSYIKALSEEIEHEAYSDS